MSARDFIALVDDICATRHLGRGAAGRIAEARRPDWHAEFLASLNPFPELGPVAPAATARGETYEALLAQHQAAGLPPGQAHLATARAHPDLHAAWLRRGAPVQAAATTAGETYESAVAAYQSARQTSLGQAYAAVARERPDLHAAWLRRGAPVQATRAAT